MVTNNAQVNLTPVSEILLLLTVVLLPNHVTKKWYKFI